MAKLNSEFVGIQMALKNTPDHFGLVSRANHWVTAFAFILAILIGIYAENFMEKGEARSDLFQLHFSLGVAIFALMMLRIIWLKISPNPLPLGDNRKEIIIAHIVKGFLYLAMLMLPITGYVMVSLKGIDIQVFGQFVLPNMFEVDKESPLRSIAKFMHVNGAYFIMAILALHIAGALKHHFILKDHTLLRMLGRPHKPKTAQAE